MAIITEEEAEHNVPKAQSKRPSKSKPQQNPRMSSTETKPHKSSSPPSNPFAFWFYFTLTISLVSVLFVSFNSLAPRDPKSWFLSLPSDLRQHYSKGRTIKIQTHRHQSPFEVFAFEQGRSESETVLIVHGLGLSSYAFRGIVQSLSGKGVRTVAIDLPGHGFSDKSVMEEAGGRSEGVLGKLRDVYDEIQEKGLFSAFDRIIETGQMPYEEIEARISERKVSKPIEFGPEEIGKVMGQVIEAMDLSPVHLVLHDSALGMTANWVSKNSKTLRSVTLLDTARGSIPVLPLWALATPVVRELVLGSSTVHAWLLNKCCSREIGSAESRAHRALLTSRDARSSIVGIGRNLNSSFDVSKWGSSQELKGVPIQVIWSESWSHEWTTEGERVSESLPQASFALHSGGRWPQEGSADEIAQSIFQFVSSMPATIRKTDEEPIPDHIQRMLDEAKNNAHHHDHDGHAHGHEAGFMDAHGHGW